MWFWHALYLKLRRHILFNYYFIISLIKDDIKGSEFDENEKIREEIKELQAPGIEHLDPEELETLITR